MKYQKYLGVGFNRKRIDGGEQEAVPNRMNSIDSYTVHCKTFTRQSSLPFLRFSGNLFDELYVNQFNKVELS